MADVGGKFRQMRIDVFIRPVPIAQGLDHEAVTQVVNPWAGMVGRPTQPDLMRYLDEPPPRNPVGQTSALLRKEEAWALGMREDSIPQASILLEFVSCGGVEWHPARFIELSLADFQ